MTKPEKAGIKAFIVSWPSILYLSGVLLTLDWQWYELLTIGERAVVLIFGGSVSLIPALIIAALVQVWVESE